MPDGTPNNPDAVQMPYGLNFVLEVMRLRVQEAWPHLTLDQRIKATNCLDRMEADVEFFAEAAVWARMPDEP